MQFSELIKKKGVVVYLVCSAIIMLIGIIMRVNNYIATGPIKGRTSSKTTNLDGTQIIIVGILMIVLLFTIFIFEKKEDNNF
jgi:uncharacterized membrane protein